MTIRMIGIVLLAAAGCGPGSGRSMTAEEVAATLASVPIEPGLWETRSQIVNVGGPNLPVQVKRRMEGGRQPLRNCLTSEQAARPEANFLAAQQNSNCEYSGFSLRNGRLEGTMICTAPDRSGTMRTTMEGQYGPRGYDMTMRMESQGAPAGANMTIETRVTARRIGDCPPGGAEQEKGGTE